MPWREVSVMDERSELSGLQCRKERTGGNYAAVRDQSRRRLQVVGALAGPAIENWLIVRGDRMPLPNAAKLRPRRGCWRYVTNIQPGARARSRTA